MVRNCKAGECEIEVRHTTNSFLRIRTNQVNKFDILKLINTLITRVVSSYESTIQQLAATFSHNSAGKLSSLYVHVDL